MDNVDWLKLLQIMKGGSLKKHCHDNEGYGALALFYLRLKRLPIDGAAARIVLRLNRLMCLAWLEVIEGVPEDEGPSSEPAQNNWKKKDEA